MRRFKQTLAAVLCVCTLFTMDSQLAVAAELPAGQPVAEQSAEELSAAELPATYTEETIGIEAEETEETEAQDTQYSPEADTSFISDPDASNQTSEAQGLVVDYLVMKSSEVMTPDSQYVLVGINNDDSQLRSAELTYRNTVTGSSYVVEADEIDTDALLFTMEYADDSWTGSYELDYITCNTDTSSQVIAIAETGISAEFGINTAVESQEDAQVLTDEQAEELDNVQGVVVTDATGAALSEDALGNAVENASAAVEDGTVASTGATMGDLVIVLDPGHGGADSGACRFGLYEKNLNLAIALACKAELETYAGVKVYMTRSDDTRPGYDQQSSLDQRVAIAQQYQADILISFHNDVAVSGSASGAKVFYPNASYNQAVSQVGSSVASRILQKLVALGLKNDGIQIRNSACGDTYADGSLADYYGLIRRGKKVGIPTLIIEHAFMSNYSDVVNYLSSSAQLTGMGVADATGIASYYGLFKGSADITLKKAVSVSSNSIKLGWSRNKNMSGYQIYRSTTGKKNSYKLIGTVSGNKTTTYTDTKCKTGRTYYYKVCGYTAQHIYNFSNRMKVCALKSTTLKSAVSVQSGQIALTWSRVKTAKGYQIYRAASKSGTYKRIKTITKNTTTSYTDTKAEAGVKYYYKIRVYKVQNKKKGYSDYSNIVKAISANVPQNVTASSRDSANIVVSWSKASGAKKYQIYRATAASGSYELVGTVSRTKDTYTDVQAEAGITYFYRVRTVNYVSKHYGYSSYSNETDAVILTTPEEVTITQESGAQLSWKTVTGAAGYHIFRADTATGDYVQLADVVNPAYTDITVTSGVEYRYKIQAYHGENNLSADSAEVLFTLD